MGTEGLAEETRPAGILRGYTGALTVVVVFAVVVIVAVAVGALNRRLPATRKTVTVTTAYDTAAVLKDVHGATLVLLDSEPRIAGTEYFSEYLRHEQDPDLPVSSDTVVGGLLMSDRARRVVMYPPKSAWGDVVKLAKGRVGSVTTASGGYRFRLFGEAVDLVPPTVRSGVDGPYVIVVNKRLAAQYDRDWLTDITESSDARLVVWLSGEVAQ